MQATVVTMPHTGRGCTLTPYCVAPKSRSQMTIGVIRIISSVGSDFRFTPVSDQIAASHYVTRRTKNGLPRHNNRHLFDRP
jgi:hypothetical protein